MESEQASKTHIAISPFYGFSLRPGTQELSLGDYVICNKNYVDINFPESKGTFQNKFQVSANRTAEIDFYFVIRKNICAAGVKEAKEIFELEVDHLINTLLYCIPVRREENRKISIRNERISQATFVRSDIKTQPSFSNRELINPLYILDEKMLGYPGNDIRLFRYLGTDPSSNIERRIKRAVSWIGQALRNPDLTEGFLELAIALETLLTFQDGFISKSITAQLAEFASFLTETELAKRKETNKKVKELYKKRSDIVHSFSTKLEEKDFASLLKILKKIVQEYFNLVDNKNVKAMEEVNSHIEDLRFS